MKTYTVIYTGNSSKYKGFEEETSAKNERDAVEKIYKSIMPENYFPQDDGSILDSDGYEIAGCSDDYIHYDGGHFEVEEIND